MVFLRGQIKQKPILILRISLLPMPYLRYHSFLFLHASSFRFPGSSIGAISNGVPLVRDMFYDAITLLFCVHIYGLQMRRPWWRWGDGNTFDLSAS